MPTLADIYLNQEPSMLTNRIQTIFGAAGIQTTADAPSDGVGDKARTVVGFHFLRHFFAAWLDNHGTNHALTNYLTCHQQGKVEARHFHENREALAEHLALSNAAGEAQTTEGEIIQPDGTDAAEGRFRAFCAAWDALASDAERERAREGVN